MQKNKQNPIYTRYVGFMWVDFISSLSKIHQILKLIGQNKENQVTLF
jgi:hypothetical protein